MGAKNSLTKKELDEANGDEVPGRLNQHAHSDDVILSGSQGRFKAITLNDSNVVGDEAAVNDEHLVLSNKAKTERAHEGPAASMAPAVQKISLGSPKRYHPYEEITDEQLSMNQKAILDNNEGKPKKNGNLQLNIGKKTKEIKIEAEVVSNQTSPASAPKEKTSRDSPGVAACGQVGENITEEQLVLNKNSKKTDKEKKSKPNQKDKNDKKKKQKVIAAVEENISTESELKLSTPGVKPIPAPRGGMYDEITDEQLACNREAKKSDKDKKLKQKDKSEVKVKKQKQEVKTNVESEVNKKVSSPVSQVKPGSESPNINSRYHPYDEITEEELSSNRKALKKKKGDKLEENIKKNAHDKEQGVIVDSEPAEYLNTAAIVASALTTQGDERCHSGKQVDKQEEDDLKDLYAVPQKRKPKANPTNELNYIEVEFNHTTSKPEVKQPYTATSYSNVVVKDGMLVLES